MSSLPIKNNYFKYLNNALNGNNELEDTKTNNTKTKSS